MKSKKVISVIVLIFIFFVQSGYSQASYKHGFKFAKFIDYLDSYYVDSIDAEELVESAIKSVLSELDPHSTYIPSEDLKKLREPLQGNFEGIGVSFNILKDTLYVISPISGGPSEKIGIQAGDKIIFVDNKNIGGIGLTNEDVFELLRGKKGTEVNLGIQRRSVSEILDFKVIRDKIPIYSVDASYMINDNTGYVKINRFSATTINEFKEAVLKLKKDNAENLVLDLSGNGGGYLDAAVKLSDEFLEEGSVVVYTEGLNSPKREYLASEYGNFKKGKVIILIDEGSASASEIVTGAIQDWDKGIVIGRRSFGKGLVQREMMLPDESALRITIAKYYTPSGRLIQKPFDEGLEEYHREIFERYNSGEMLSPDSITFPDSLKYSTLVKNRTVFGGGGIMPDIFIPYDTSNYSDYYRDIVRKGILNRFVLEYVDDNRAKINKEFSGFQSFKPNFVVDLKLLQSFESYAEKEGVTKNPEELEISKSQIKIMIKALIARDLYGNDEFYQIYNTTNNSYIKALEVLKNWDTFIVELL